LDVERQPSNSESSEHRFEQAEGREPNEDATAAIAPETTQFRTLMRKGVAATA